MTAEKDPYTKSLEERLEAAREALAEVRKVLGCGLEDDEVVVAKRLAKERGKAYAALKQVRDALGAVSVRDVVEAARKNSKERDDLLRAYNQAVEERDEARQRAAGLESMVQQHQQETIYWWGRAWRAEARVEEMDPPKREGIYVVPIGESWASKEGRRIVASGLTTPRDAELAMRLLAGKK